MGPGRVLGSKKDFLESTIKISPSFGDLSMINASYPHHLGNIEINLTKKGSGVEGEITISQGMKGDFIWMTKKIILKPGKQKITI